METVEFWERIRIPDYTDPEQVRHGTIGIDHETCQGCFLCQAVCPASAITRGEGRPLFVAGSSECIFCGNCAAICPVGAINLIDPYRYRGRFATIGHCDPQKPRR
ncbi:MAG: 4Fe-4S binding protein [Proteobacteria bacterium]|nr:4Fe-4S binding protein [Pseudomonadota bacterium]